MKIYPVTALPSSSEAKGGNPAPDFPPGSIVATRDSAENPRLIWLSTVTAISADDAEWRAVEYFATRSHRAPFRFLPCWVDERDDALVLAKRKPAGKFYSRWTGMEHVDNILASGLSLTASGSLSAASARALDAAGLRPQVV